MTKFKGLCIGGPLDGKWRETEDPYLVAVKRVGSLVPNWNMEVSEPDLQIVKVHYERCYISTGTNDGVKTFNFWTVDKAMTVAEIIETLIENYKAGYADGQKEMRRRAAEKVCLLMPYLGRATVALEAIEALPIEEPK